MGKKNRRDKKQELKFTDKYLYGSTYGDKYDAKRNSKEKRSVSINRERASSVLKAVLGVVLSVCLVGFGYTVMQVIMARTAMPEEFLAGEITTSEAQEEETEAAPPSLADSDVTLQAATLSTTYLDGGAMMASYIEDVKEKGYNAAVIELKRSDGTLAYDSALTDVQTYSAVSSAAKDLAGSVKLLQDHDIIPVARIYCFEDPLASSKNTDLSVLTDSGDAWEDAEGNTWLNPYSVSARDYLLSILKEAQDLGFQCIILEGLSFPESKTQDAVFADGVTGSPNEQSIQSFFQEAQDALGSQAWVMESTAIAFQDAEGLLEKMTAYSQEYANNRNRIPILYSAMEEEEFLEFLEETAIDHYIYAQALTDD
ncbi:MAG: putative glycoside hydrolase [Clostridiales bacterium]|nr:putative glycoside hydrolase [Clostridiales bacterium]